MKKEFVKKLSYLLSVYPALVFTVTTIITFIILNIVDTTYNNFTYKIGVSLLISVIITFVTFIILLITSLPLFIVKKTQKKKETLEEQMVRLACIAYSWDYQDENYKKAYPNNEKIREDNINEREENLAKIETIKNEFKKDYKKTQIPFSVRKKLDELFIKMEEENISDVMKALDLFDIEINNVEFKELLINSVTTKMKNVKGFSNEIKRHLLVNNNIYKNI